MTVIEQIAQDFYLGGIQPAIPKLILIFSLVIIAIIGLKVLDKLTRKMRGKFGDKLQFKIVAGLIQIIFLSIIVIIMLSQIGVTQDFLTFLGLIVTGIIAFSSTSLIANLVSGLILHFTRPFYVGDVIKIGTVVGKVIAVKSVYTLVYTFEKTKVEIPNSTFIKDNVINYSSEGFRIQIPISLSYDINRVIVENALIRAAKLNNLEDVFVAIKFLDNNYITYELNGTTREAEGLPFVKSFLNKTILDEFNAEEIEIASPSLISHRKVSKLLVKAGKKETELWKRKQRLDQISLQKLIKDTFELKKPKVKKKYKKKTKKKVKKK